MATLQVSRALFSVGSTSCQKGTNVATVNASKIHMSLLSLPKLRGTDLLEELNTRSGYTTATTSKNVNTPINNATDRMVISKLNAILKAVADRVEMHRNIEQRDNWNRLLLTSINAITLSAATMTGLAAAANVNGAPHVALKVSSTMLYLAATGMLVVMSKIQSSQLAEEQRIAARLFKHLHGQIQTMVTLRVPSVSDVNEAMEKVFALDKAHPLPLIGAMLEKFPSDVKPAVWWPQGRRKQGLNGNINRNGWSEKLEEK